MIRLFHVSDVHFGAEDRAAVAWFDRAVKAEKPDAIIMTGDLTMRARSREFEQASAWLEGLQRPTTVEVGNHDLPYFNPFARFLMPYHRYKQLERVIEQPLDIRGITVVPLKTTARFQMRFNWSKGFVGKKALQTSLGLLDAVPKGDLVFVAAHHPLIEAGTRSTGKTRHGREALEALAAAGVDAVLSGHVHDPFDVEEVVNGRTIRLVGAGTLSVRTRDNPPSFNEIRIQDGKFETIARRMGEADYTVTEPQVAAEPVG
ncbi:metallophosphoesterase family protein [Sphingomonas desiccabilis]|uniref:Metallophosphoesterase n=1 Tax=Sphingomonas desiccabilis TaxID=429134 RepID=A0A4V1QPU1_9SPHN|nr:metallophosphoesterase [Sphingomonas desiccabilis]MBB3910314.1 3',5'-cyclic AMP phosphodiesterase CpdA [Sphingomonas desiccabilis]RXZ34977.1 metallophosphoesterase [Sphingomonas desiccabilis]